MEVNMSKINLKEKKNSSEMCFTWKIGFSYISHDLFFFFIQFRVRLKLCTNRKHYVRKAFDRRQMFRLFYTKDRFVKIFAAFLPHYK